jgi:catechol 2,3-dioxygenase-like lactoylglutathione lyase family enzyme
MIGHDTSVQFTSAVPQFTVADVVATAEYYRDVLGFQIAGYWADPPLFAIVWRDEVEIFFNQANSTEVRSGRADGAYDVYLRISGVNALAAELRARGADIVAGPELRIYGQRELVVRDCNGLILAFGEEADRAA